MFKLGLSPILSQGVSCTLLHIFRYVNLKLTLYNAMSCRLLRFGASPIMFSTLENGKIVKGIAGVPNEGPVLLVGYHMLMGLELSFLIEEFLREKNIMVRGVAHPELFLERRASPSDEFSYFDWTRIYGAVPVTASNLFKLFSKKSHILLYPGGAREALHRKVCHTPVQLD